VAVIADRMKGLGSAAEVSSAAFAIFGDAGIRMVSMLREGGDAIRAARAEVDDFGLSLSAVDAAAVGRASNALARIGRTAEVAATRLTVTLAPAIEMTAQWFNELARANNGWRDAADAGADRIVRGLAYVADAALWAQRAYVALEIANQTWNATAIAGLRVVLGLLSQIPACRPLERRARRSGHPPGRGPRRRGDPARAVPRAHGPADALGRHPGGLGGGAPRCGRCDRRHVGHRRDTCRPCSSRSRS
jgi:hypothetical protein